MRNDHFVGVFLFWKGEGGAELAAEGGREENLLKVALPSGVGDCVNARGLEEREEVVLRGGEGEGEGEMKMRMKAS